MILMGAREGDILVEECCPSCSREATILWNIGEDGYHAYCPYCGNRLMLCSECPATFGDGSCDYDSAADRCKMQRSDL